MTFSQPELDPANGLGGSMDPEEEEALTTPVTDPVTNPSPADVTAAIENANSEIVLGRIGHYSYQSTCQTAIVVRAGSPRLNLTVFQQDGQTEGRTSVLCGRPRDGEATFHLNRDCPWGR